MQKEVLRLFISSPGDVDAERDRVRTVVEKINRQYGDEKQVTIEILDWKSDVVPEIGERGQEIINRGIGEYDVFVGIMWKRFGTPTGKKRADGAEEYLSGTEEEFEIALQRRRNHKRLHILFYFNTAAYSPRNSEELAQWARVMAFKEKCQKLGLIREYASTEEFADLLHSHLHEIVKKWAPGQKEKTGKPIITDRSGKSQIPQEYMNWLAERLAKVELLVTVPKEGFTQPRLSSLYVPAPTTPWEKSVKNDELLRRTHGAETVSLLDRLNKESLLVSGIAGCGKSTFARWVAFLLASGKMPDEINFAEEERIVEKYPRLLANKLPLLIPLREFWPFVIQKPGQDSHSRKELLQALESYVKEKMVGLEVIDLTSIISEGKAVLLFDGFDEVPESSGENKSMSYPRRALLTGLAEIFPLWQSSGNRILFTTRPHGLKEGEAQQLGIAQASIVDLSRPLQRLFVRRWFHALNCRPQLAEEMLAHLEERDELAPLSGNPVLLMAMCSLFPQGKRLPQDKSELYRMTIDRLLFNRYKTDSEVAINHNRLGVLAYSMHTGEWLGLKRSTPLAEITFDEIEKVLSEYLQEQPFYEKGQRAVSEVREELLSRSGLLVGRPDEKASFYHLTFQEYLAGRRLLQTCCGQLEEAIRQYGDIPEWRQTLAFAFGSTFSSDSVSRKRSAQIIKSLMELSDFRQINHLVLLSDFVEILYGKNLRLEPEMAGRFQNLCLEAIEHQVPIQKRFDLGRVLGIIGDPRVAIDLRQPEGYISIPAGIYKHGEKKATKELAKSCLISRFPVTNAQYDLFIKDGGYTDMLHWWSEEGLSWRRRERITEPRYWRHGRWKGANFPVVGVSFYEAEAFCAWARGRLPTEQEWEAAAAGPDGLNYPWGDKYLEGICNGHDSDLGRTSPVGLFPKSRSSTFGLEDMAGNVWEWCVNWYDKNRTGCVVRGGSFVNDARWLRCSYRFRLHPVSRDFSIGFRVVRGVPS